MRSLIPETSGSDYMNTEPTNGTLLALGMSPSRYLLLHTEDTDTVCYFTLFVQMYSSAI